MSPADRPAARGAAPKQLEARVHERLGALEAEGLRRRLRAPAGVDLSSNDYLNLSTDPRVVAAFREAVEREGCGSTGSRLLRGERHAFARVENRFAEFKGTDRALYFSSGYLANLAAIGTFAEAGDIVFSDERNHASLIDAVRLSRARVVIVPHNDVRALARLLRQASEEQKRSNEVRFVVVESLYSMDGDFAPLADLAALCRDDGAVLVVDEAHAVGIYGERGTGLIEAAGLDPNGCLSINTAGKALGAAGAFVAGPAWAIEYLVQRARPFVFSTAAPPAIAGAIEASLSVVREDATRRRRLLARASFLRDALRRAGVPLPDGRSQIVPIRIGDNDRAVAVAAALQAQGFDVRAIRPPSVPPGTARLRVSVNAGLSEEIIQGFVDALARALDGVGATETCSEAIS
jgi:8-amino-7-oxononanoate synthase